MKDVCVVSILNRIIGPNVEFLSVKSVYKNKFTRFGSPWHQDWYYWKGANKISVWIALDDATPENGCLKMIAGSHFNRFKVKQVIRVAGNEERTSETTLGVFTIKLKFRSNTTGRTLETTLANRPWKQPSRVRATRFSFTIRPCTVPSSEYHGRGTEWSSTVISGNLSGRIRAGRIRYRATDGQAAL